MGILIRTPFKSNSLETDPYVYGLRPIIIKTAITELYNDKSILITGTRGIGKSSLSYQLQKVLSGNNVILKRCDVDIEFTGYITVNYVCTSEDSLESLVLNLILLLEEKLEVISNKLKLKQADISFSFIEIFKTTLKFEKSEKECGSLVKGFVNVIEKFSEIYKDPHINIAIDELDQLDKNEKIAQFIKAVLENLAAKEENILSFILVGQNELFNTLYNQQPAFHRLVKYIKLLPLSNENTEEVLYACLGRSEIQTTIEQDAKNMLINLSGGYPASIQLLGHETFVCGLKKYNKRPDIIILLLQDIIGGVKNAILNDAARFEVIMKDLDGYEKNCILSMANVKQALIPFTYNVSHVLDGLPIRNDSDKLELSKKIINSLINKQILLVLDDDSNKEFHNRKFRFKEELLRVYLNYKINNNEMDIDYE